MITLPTILMPTILFGADPGCWKLDDNFYLDVVRRYKDWKKKFFALKNETENLLSWIFGKMILEQGYDDPAPAFIPWILAQVYQG